MRKQLYWLSDEEWRRIEARAAAVRRPRAERCTLQAASSARRTWRFRSRVKPALANFGGKAIVRGLDVFWFHDCAFSPVLPLHLAQHIIVISCYIFW